MSARRVQKEEQKNGKNDVKCIKRMWAEKGNSIGSKGNSGKCDVAENDLHVLLIEEWDLTTIKKKDTELYPDNEYYCRLIELRQIVVDEWLNVI